MAVLGRFRLGLVFGRSSSGREGWLRFLAHWPAGWPAGWMRNSGPHYAHNALARFEICFGKEKTFFGRNWHIQIHASDQLETNPCGSETPAVHVSVLDQPHRSSDWSQSNRRLRLRRPRQNPRLFLILLEDWKDCFDHPTLQLLHFSWANPINQMGHAGHVSMFITNRPPR